MDNIAQFFNVFEDIVKKNSAPSIQIGTYKDGGIIYNGLTIPSAIVKKLDYLTKKRAIKVSGTVGIGGGGKSPHTHPFTDTSTYIDEIKNGDTIVFQKINKGLFIIIGRLE